MRRDWNNGSVVPLLLLLALLALLLYDGVQHGFGTLRVIELVVAGLLFLLQLFL